MSMSKTSQTSDVVARLEALRDGQSGDLGTLIQDTLDVIYALRHRSFEVEEMIVPGDFENPLDDTDIIDQAAQVLDSVDAANLIEQNLILGSDGKFYVVTTEAVLGEANPAYAKGTIQDMVNMLQEASNDAVELGEADAVVADIQRRLKHYNDLLSRIPN